MVKKNFAPFSFVYISSIFGSGMRDRQPLDLPSVMTFCCRSFIFLKSIHNLFLKGFPDLDFFGTTTMGLAQGDILLVITPALSRVSISSCTHLWCLSAKVYGLELMQSSFSFYSFVYANCWNWFPCSCVVR